MITEAAFLIKIQKNEYILKITKLLNVWINAKKCFQLFKQTMVLTL